jgi:hypothetical protein
MPYSDLNRKLAYDDCNERDITKVTEHVEKAQATS